jgi:hypothetical protein
VAPPAGDTPPTAVRVLPLGWVVVGLVVLLAVLLCSSLRMTSTGLLVASAERDSGRVVACRYFAGTHVEERQHAAAASGADRHISCPLIGAR